MSRLHPGMVKRKGDQILGGLPNVAAVLTEIVGAARENRSEELETLIFRHDAALPVESRGKWPIEFEEALCVAIHAGHLESAECLLKTDRVSQQQAFKEALGAPKKLECLDLIYRHGFKLDENWLGSHELFYYITIPDHLDVLPWLLLQKDFDINYWGPCKTLLDRAARHGSIDALKFLIDHGADIRQTDVLHSAAASSLLNDFGTDSTPERRGRFEIEDDKILSVMHYLVHEVAVDVDAVSFFPRSRHRGESYKQTALHSAIHARKHSRVLFLLEHGADLGIEDCFGRTALRFAHARAEMDATQASAYFLDRREAIEAVAWWQQEAIFLEKWMKEGRGPEKEDASH